MLLFTKKKVKYDIFDPYLSNTPEGLEKMIRAVKHHSEEQNLYLNAKKTKNHENRQHF